MFSDLQSNGPKLLLLGKNLTPVVLEEKTLHSSMKGHVRHLLAPHFLIIVSESIFSRSKKDVCNVSGKNICKENI